MDLEGKIALVTGAASGIGRACAERLAAEGAQVMVTDLAGSGIDDTVAAICAAGGHAEPLALDVTREEDWLRAMEVARGLGGLDILVNNAGFGRVKSIDEETLEGWRSVNACIFEGPFLGMKAAIPLMRERGEGSIVTIASGASFSGVPNAVAYCAGKAGMVGLTRSVAMHCAHSGYNIRVNAVHPGAIGTPALLADDEQMLNVRRILEKATPLKRLGRPEEIADAVVFLAGPRSTFITGASLLVDGGHLAQ